MSPTSSVEASARPLYVVYGYRRDADEFARERGLRKDEVISVFQGARGLRGVGRPIVIVDTDHSLSSSAALAWHEISQAARVINARLGAATEHVEWYRS